MRAFRLLSLALAVLSVARMADAQPLLHFYELGIEVNDSAVQLDIYKAGTGEPVSSATIHETGGTPDAQYDTNSAGGPGIGSLPEGLLVLVFTPVSCGAQPGCVPLAQPISYAWAGNSNPITAGTFYRPAQGSGYIDTDFVLNSGVLNVRSHDSDITGSGYINTALGNTGWTLPYDRTALCAAVTCTGPGPTGQFFSAGVSTTPVYNGTWDTPQGLKLVPTFQFKGTVAPPTTWGTLTWNVPNLQLRFLPGKQLELNAPLNATGATFTAADPASGWGGVQFNAGSGGAWTNLTAVEYVTGDDPSEFSGQFGRAAVTVDGASPTFDNVFIQNPVAGTILIGLKVTGSAAAPAATEMFVTDMTGRGVLVNGGARLDLFRGQITGSNGPAVGVAGTGTRAFLRRALTGDQRGPQIFLNEGGGVSATSSAEVRFGTDDAAAPGYGYASVTGNGTTTSGRGLSAATGADIYAGAGTVAAGQYQRNRVFGNGGSSATGNAYASGTGSTVYARCAWWNTTDPAVFRVGSAAGALTDASYYLTADPYTTATPACMRDIDQEPANRTSAGTERLASGGTAGRGTPEAEADGLDRLAEAMSAGASADAVARLASLVADLPATEAATAAIGEAGVIASQPGAPASAAALVTAAAASPHAALRVAAWQARVAIRRAAGDHAGALAATDALALEGGAAAVQAEVARVYLHAEAGDGTASLAALAALEALAPGSVEAELARALVGPESAPVASKRGDGATAADALDADAPGTEASRTADVPAGTALAVGPNPAGASASLSLTLAEASEVTVVVYDLLGRAVATPLQGVLTVGEHRAAVDVASLAPGVYVVRALVNTAAGAVVQTARLTVTR